MFQVPIRTTGTSDRRGRWLAGLAGLAFAGTLAAQTSGPPPYGMSLNIDQAKRMVAAAEAEAMKNNWGVVIAVVDTGGHLLALHRLDGTQTGSVDIAAGKARTAVAFRRPTKVLEESLQTSPRFLAVEGAMPLEGGIPVIVDGKIVGGIGVSGVTAQQDAQVATAGMAALK